MVLACSVACPFGGGVSSCPLGAGGRLLWLVLLSRRVPRLLSSLLLCLWCITLEYGSISRFRGVLEGFGAFVGVCVAWVLCLACVAFVRVWS